MGVNAPDGKGNITAYATYISINPVTASNFDYTACALNSGDDLRGRRLRRFRHGLPGARRQLHRRPGRPRQHLPAAQRGDRRLQLRPDQLPAASRRALRPGRLRALRNHPDVRGLHGRDVHGGQLDRADRAGRDLRRRRPGPGRRLSGQLQQPADDRGPAAARSAAPTPARRSSRQPDHRAPEHRRRRPPVGLPPRGIPHRGRPEGSALARTGPTTPSCSTARPRCRSAPSNYFVTSRINNALRAERNAAGQIVCRRWSTASDPACVPYNIFQIGGVTHGGAGLPAGPGLLERQHHRAGGQRERGRHAPPTASRARWPTTASASRSARNTVASTSISRPTSSQASGQLNGAGGASPPVNGGYDVYELFGEARVPLVQDQAWAKDITLELAYRYLGLLERRRHQHLQGGRRLDDHRRPALARRLQPRRPRPERGGTVLAAERGARRHDRSLRRPDQPAPRWSPAAPPCSA